MLRTFALLAGLIPRVAVVLHSCSPVLVLPMVVALQSTLALAGPSLADVSAWQAVRRRMLLFLVQCVSPLHARVHADPVEPCQSAQAHRWPARLGKRLSAQAHRRWAVLAQSRCVLARVEAAREER
jgi:hypothetical protein